MLDTRRRAAEGPILRFLAKHIQIVRLDLNQVIFSLPPVLRAETIRESGRFVGDSVE